MAKYRKKPVIIEATRWWRNGDHPLDNTMRPFDDTGKLPVESREGVVVRYFRRPDVLGETICSRCYVRMHDHGWIDTLEDGHTVCPGDWIITGIKGEYYPIKDYIFRETYDEVSDDYVQA